MFDKTNLLLVALGGMIGSVLRYMLSVFVSSRFSSTTIPWGTFTVNILGSFVIGLVSGLGIRNQQFELQWRLFLATGVCGGFTTFSALSNESYILLKEQQFTPFFIYIAVSLVLGIMATALGYLITK